MDVAEPVPAGSAVKAGLLAAGVFLLVFVVLSLLLLNLAIPWIESAGNVRAAASRLLWLVVPVLIIDAASALLAAFSAAGSALSRGCTRRIIIAVSVAPPLIVAVALAAAGASTQRKPYTTCSPSRPAAGPGCSSLSVATQGGHLRRGDRSRGLP